MLCHAAALPTGRIKMCEQSSSCSCSCSCNCLLLNLHDLLGLLINRAELQRLTISTGASKRAHVQRYLSLELLDLRQSLVGELLEPISSSALCCDRKSNCAVLSTVCHALPAAWAGTTIKVTFGLEAYLSVCTCTACCDFAALASCSRAVNCGTRKPKADQ
jgi:hypothetical protein